MLYLGRIKSLIKVKFSQPSDSQPFEPCSSAVELKPATVILQKMRSTTIVTILLVVLVAFAAGKRQKKLKTDDELQKVEKTAADKSKRSVSL